MCLCFRKENLIFQISQKIPSGHRSSKNHVKEDQITLSSWNNDMDLNIYDACYFEKEKKYLRNSKFEMYLKNLGNIMHI